MAKRAAKRTRKTTRRTTRRSPKRKTHDAKKLIPWAVVIFVIVLIVALANSPIGQFQDSDGDGLSNYLESVYGSSEGTPDTDGDGCLDGAEAFVYCTDVLNADCDPAVTPAC